MSDRQYIDSLKPKDFFKVEAKCGHVGRKSFVPITFAVVAHSKKDAARKVRSYPRVKHNHKDAILDVQHIDYETYVEIIKNNHKDPYLHCQSKHEQKKTCNLSGRLHVDKRNQEKKIDKNIRKSKIAFKAKKDKELNISYEEEETLFLNEESNV